MCESVQLKLKGCKWHVVKLSMAELDYALNLFVLVNMPAVKV